jgi:hypothetical protein
MIKRIAVGGILGLAAASLWVAGAQRGAASSSWQGATVVPPPVGTVQPPPGTPNRTVYPIPAPQGTSVTGREFDEPTFDRLWRRTDYPVITGRVKRSFFWGPGSLTENLTEEYAEGMGGWRAVQYFDKARMEINNPNANRNDPFFVTNGLLAVELITGEMQVGNNRFRLRWPAQINIASDSDDPLAPTYASFRGAYARLNDNELSGKVVNARIDRQGHLDFEFGGVGYANLDRFGVRNCASSPRRATTSPMYSGIS